MYTFEIKFVLFCSDINVLDYLGRWNEYILHNQLQSYKLDCYYTEATYKKLKNSARVLNIENLLIEPVIDSMKLEVIYIGCAY